MSGKAFRNWSNKEKAEYLITKSLRTCYSMHECCICGDTIHNSSNYYCGGHGKRGHVTCVDKELEEYNYEINA